MPSGKDESKKATSSTVLTQELIPEILEQQGEGPRRSKSFNSGKIPPPFEHKKTSKREGRIISNSAPVLTTHKGGDPLRFDDGGQEKKWGLGAGQGEPIIHTAESTRGKPGDEA